MSLDNPGSDCKASCVVSCPAGWEREGDRCYFFSEEEKSWDEAEEACMKETGHLTSVTSEQVHMYFQGKGFAGWVGGLQKDNKWVWTDCSEWEFDSGWGDGEPSTGGEKCVEYNEKLRHLWNNMWCGNKRKFVCSKKVCPGTI